MRFAYLGPEGTFTETALRSILPRHRPHAPAAECTPFTTVFAAMDAVRRGMCAAAVVPLENSRRGVVPATLNGLVADADLHIVAEAVVQVSFTLMAARRVEFDRLTRVLSHPHALAQCGKWLRRELPGARLVPTGSTADAARAVAASSDSTLAAIAAQAAADRYRLHSLAENIGEHQNAVTRFVMVRRAGTPPRPTGRDRTALLVSADIRASAALQDILSVFSTAMVYPAWVQTVPAGPHPDRYRVFVDVDGHIDDQPVSRAAAALPAVGANTSFLGSYPRTPRTVRSTPPPDTL